MAEINAVKNNPSDEALKQASTQLINSRPTAINLRWAVDIMNAELKDLPENERYPASIKKSQSICDDDVAYCKKIGEFGNKIIVSRTGLGIRLPGEYFGKIWKITQ